MDVHFGRESWTCKFLTMEMKLLSHFACLLPFSVERLHESGLYSYLRSVEKAFMVFKQKKYRIRLKKSFPDLYGEKRQSNRMDLKSAFYCFTILSYGLVISAFALVAEKILCCPLDRKCRYCIISFYVLIFMCINYYWYC